MAEITVIAKKQNLDTVIKFIKTTLAQSGCPQKLLRQLPVAVEEIFVNTAYYAYAPEEGPITVCCEVSGEPLKISIGFIDHGRPYNPLTKSDPDISLKAKERPAGGLGIFMTKHLMDDIHYEFIDGKNILKMSKQI